MIHFRTTQLLPLLEAVSLAQPDKLAGVRKTFCEVGGAGVCVGGM
jgi:hypothetical protein